MSQTVEDTPLSKALRYKIDHPGESLRTVARKFNISRKTLARFHNDKLPKHRGGHNKLFTEAEYRELNQFLERQESMGFTLDRNMLVLGVTNIVSKHKQRIPMPSDSWLKRYMKASPLFKTGRSSRYDDLW